MAFEQWPLDRNEVHDWKNAGATKIIGLHFDMVRDEANHVGMAGNKTLWRNCRQDRVNFASEQHIVERLVGSAHEPDVGQIDAEVDVAARLVGAGLHPFDLFELQADVVHQVAARINSRGVSKVGISDAPAAKLFERVDAAAFLDVERRMPKNPRRKDRDRHQTVVALRKHPSPFSKRHFADVPFLVARGAIENLRRRQDLEIDIEPLGVHAARNKIAHVVVVADRQGNLQLAHVACLASLPAADLRRPSRPCRSIGSANRDKECSRWPSDEGALQCREEA